MFCEATDAGENEQLVLWILWITVARSFALMQVLMWNTRLLSSNFKVGQNICFICKTPHFEIARQFKIQGGPEIAEARSLPAGPVQRKQAWKSKKPRFYP